MESRYELFDHTADMGVLVFAPTMAELVPAATAGLYAVIGELVAGDAAATTAWRWEGRGEDAAGLLRDYLAEVLLLFERDGRMVTDIRVPTFDERRLVVEGTGRSVDEERSGYDREVKAVTYHELAVRPVDGGFEARVIVDI